MELAKAYKECEKVIKLHSKTFYRAFSMLPAKERKAVWAIYSFCRTVDDIVDESDTPEAELAAFEEEFERFLSARQNTSSSDTSRYEFNSLRNIAHISKQYSSFFYFKL